MRRLVAVLSATLLVVPLTLALTAGPSSAGGEVSELDASVACQPDGSATVTWTLNNFTDVTWEVVTANIEGVATQVLFSPNPIPAGTSATATTSVAGTVKGQITLHVSIKAGESELTAITTEGLPGDCEPVGTVVTTAVPTSAAPTSAVQAAAATQPHFTG